LEWRSLIPRSRKALTLDDILADLWGRGIPVIPLDVLPSPSPQGIACIVEGRPVILLGHKYDEPGRVAFLIAHETGHIAAGDCAPGQPVVDEEEGVVDDSDMERRAENYARSLLLGNAQLANLDDGNFKQLANAAVSLERTTGADASLVIFTWAVQTRDYAKATMAVKALYRANGARRTLRRFFDRHVDVESASESDRSLLRCVYGDPG
jgi:Zn-dependent peptidase ImmA (M78 family)